MSQAALAGDDFTKGFISLLETGRTRMSLRAAEIFANRLGVTASDLVRASEPSTSTTVELALTRAEGELAAGRAEAALELAERAVPRGAEQSGRVLRLRGRALAKMGKRREALKLMDEALRSFRSKRDAEGTARTLFDLANVHVRLEENAEALNLALQCEHAINSGLIVDRTLELRVMEFIAAVSVSLGDFNAADLRTERAKALAEDVSDPRTVASLYENLTITRQRQGDLEGALLYARKALEARERLEDQHAIGSAWNSIGWVYVKRRQLGRAKEALDRASDLATATEDGRLMGYVLQSRAELELARSNADAAVRLADESIALLDASPRCKAISRLIRAEALAQSKASDAVVSTAFRAAIEALEPHGRRLLARAYQAHFEAMSARGRLKDANVSARRAMELLQPAIS
jgi:tetratricopeptide (TPR) repeat protein